MKVLLAPDSFKETITAIDVCQVVSEALKTSSDSGQSVSFQSIPMSDGGDGFISALSNVFNSSSSSSRLEKIVIEVMGPLQQHQHNNKNIVKATFGFVAESRFAVIEMAEASGLHLVPQTDRNPFLSSTFGTGQVILDAIRRGAQKILLGIGGSATMDGGLGALQALGLEIYLNNDNNNNLPLQRPFVAQDLPLITKVKWPENMAIPTIDIACDVTNPFCGPTGSSFVYGPQKGATPQMCHDNNEALRHVGVLLEQTFGRKILDMPGAGAAGSMGGSFHAVLGCALQKGCDLFASYASLERAVESSDLIITGEGSFDEQSAQGKVLSVLFRLARKYNKPITVLCGQSKVVNLDDINKNGTQRVRIFQLVDYFPLKECMGNTKESLRKMVVMNSKSILYQQNGVSKL